MDIIGEYNPAASAVVGERPGMVAVPRHLTLDEFLQLPDEEPPLEYIDGGICQKVSPKSHHSALQAELVERINAIARQTKIARAFPELRITFAGASRVPDIAVYRWRRIPRDAGGSLVQDFLAPPDVAIEIVSPGQSVNAMLRRCRWYVSNGVEAALLVDPMDRSVLRFLPDAGVEEWQGADRIDLGDVVPGFELTVEALFKSLTE